MNLPSPSFIDRHNADAITCETMHKFLMKRTDGRNIKVLIQGGSMDGKKFHPSGSPIAMPSNSQMLSELFKGDTCKIYVQTDITLTGLDSTEMMTRRGFVMQTLDIWERLLARATAPHLAQHREDLVTAMEALKSTYSLEELVPEDGFTMTQFRAYFQTGGVNVGSNTSVSENDATGFSR